MKGRRAAAASLCMWLAAAAAVAQSSAAPAIVGTWQTIDDHTGKPRGIVRLYEENGRLFGRIEGAVRPDAASLRCIKCTDERKDQPIIGLVIIRNMQRDGDEYAGGDILDPDSGTVYRCKIRLDGSGRLLVRGYLGIALFGRSQTWLRGAPKP